MRRQTVRSFVSGLALGAVLGALLIWLSTPQRRELRPEWRERMSGVVDQARASGERLAATVRQQLAATRQRLAKQSEDGREARERGEAASTSENMGVRSES